MLRTLSAVGLLIIAVAAASWMVSGSAPSAPTHPIATEGITCGTHQCSQNAICCPNCATGEPRCVKATRCPECAPR